MTRHENGAEDVLPRQTVRILLENRNLTSDRPHGARA